MRLALLFLLAASAAYPQRLLSFGFKIGHPFKDVLKSGLTVNTVLTPSSGSFTLGPTVELNLPRRLSVEGDILYRPLTYDVRYTGAGSLPQYQGGEWRFPILLKYRLKGGFVRPFLAGGPAWQKITGFSNAADFEKRTATGGVAAAGLEGKLALFTLSGELRYTRWGSASIRSVAAGLKRAGLDEVDFLMGFTF